LAEAHDPAAVRRRLEALDARHLWIVYHDYAGLGRGKAVARERIEDVAAHGVTFAKANWDFAITDHYVPQPGFGPDAGDFRVIPDPAAIVPVPYREGVALAFGWLADDLGAPWPGDPRARLRDQVAALAAGGLTAQVAFEAEFVLFGSGPDGRWVPADRGRMFTVDEIEARWAWCATVLAALQAMGVAVHQLAKEYGPAQYEISLLPTDPVAAVDRFLVARQVIKALARDEGLVASFMPKPYAELPGNGLHVHLSLGDAEGRDALADPTDESGLSPAAAAAIGGLLDHAAAQAALGSPTPNSYKRLLPGTWAPAHVCWAFGNRAALVRVPGRGPARHLEYRSGDASCNPYLHVAGLLAGIRDGLDRKVPLPPSADLDVGHLTDAEAAVRGFVRLPDRPATALDALAGDAVLQAALGPLIAEHYLVVKRFELDSYLAESGASPDTTSVTDWERATYLEHL